MNKKQINKIFSDTAYVRMGGSEKELECANYIINVLKGYSLNAILQPFEVQMTNLKIAKLFIDGKSIECKGYFNCGTHDITAPIYYLTADDEYSLENCRGKIVIFDGYLRCWRYRDLVAHGALGFITYNGDMNYGDSDIDQRELRAVFVENKKLPGMAINVKDAVKIIQNECKTARILIQQEEYVGNSHNVVLEIKGKSEKTIVFTAHYDSTSLSQGAYDNMSGCVGLIALAERFSKTTPNHTLRFIWCGSEERGLLGSKAYCALCEDKLSDIVLNINLDMIGCIMGKFIACCTSENALVGYVKYMADELGFQVKAYQDVYSSDSTPFADKGIPAISFARIAPHETATIHNSYDTAKVLKAEQMQKDIEFIACFTERMVNAKRCPVKREIPDNIKEKLDEYLLRKRKKQ